MSKVPARGGTTLYLYTCEKKHMHGVSFIVQFFNKILLLRPLEHRV
jgi:hypothetical protein